jgi:invasion protein IalB
MTDLFKPVLLASLLMGTALTSTAVFAQETATPTAEQTESSEGTVAAEGTENAAEAAAPEAETPNADVAMALNMGTEEGGELQIGATYTLEESGDWQVRCVKTNAERDPCQLYQLLSDEAGNSVAEINILPLPAGQQAAAGANIIVPLETLLNEQLRIAVDGAKARRYPYTFCSVQGCLARVGFSNADVAAFKRGNKATLTIVPAVAPDQRVDLTISLTGFTAGMEAVTKAAGLN